MYVAESLGQGQDRVGARLAGTYRIERLLGAGAAGAVYAARNLRTGGRVAVKVLHAPMERAAAQVSDPRGARARFLAEARVLAELQHSGLVRVFDVHEPSDGPPFLVMELLLGEDLRRCLARRRQLPLDRALRLAFQAGTALHVAHQRGVIHRDLKPSNLFLAWEQRDDQIIEQAKVIDFGVSRRHGDPRLTAEHQPVGTPRYMAPEQARGLQADERTDQFALGAVFFEMLAGRPLFADEPIDALLRRIAEAGPADIAPALGGYPPQLLQVLKRALAPRPALRYPTMLDFVNDLRAAAPAPASWPLPQEPRPDAPLDAPDEGGDHSDAVTLPLLAEAQAPMG